MQVKFKVDQLSVCLENKMKERQAEIYVYIYLYLDDREAVGTARLVQFMLKENQNS